MIKNSVNELVYAADDATMHMDYDQTLLTHETKDRKEAVLSFFEKRDPEFTQEQVETIKRKLGKIFGDQGRV